MAFDRESFKQQLRAEHPLVFAVVSGLNQRRGAMVSASKRARRAAEDRALGALAPRVHPLLLRRLPKDRPLRVVFVVLHRAIWKLDPLFEAMLAHPDFDPVVLVAPAMDRFEGFLADEQVATWDRFTAEGRRCVMARTPAVSRRPQAEVVGSLAELRPDFVFMTNPHRLTTAAYYQRALLSHLCCYVPYSVDVSSYGGNQTQFNQGFHNAVWRVFAPHEASRAIYRAVQDRQAANVEVSGYPALERLVNPPADLGDPWRASPTAEGSAQRGRKLRIIYAPHHTLDDPQLPLGTFLKVGEGVQALVERYADRVQWAFKPHPMLERKLAAHPDWGPERTDAYFRFFAEHPSCQLEQGPYEALFYGSDAMVHDCGSFLAEYHYTDHPALFLRSRPDITDFLNSYGVAAADASVRGADVADIEGFIEALLAGEDPNQAERRAFAATHGLGESSPSERIIATLLAARDAA